MSASLLRVFVDEKRVGTLLYEDYAYQFRYEDPASLDAQRDLVSLTMPVRHRSYDTQVMPPPFQSVLPEGDLLIRLRARFGKVLHLDDDFDLLRLVGHNTIGRVSFREADAPTHEVLPHPDRQALLRHPDTRALFNELVDTYGARFGIGGTQPKALVAVGAAQATVPTERFIIKMAGADFPMLPVNEHFCLEASRAAQIPTVGAELSDDHALLLVDRFDRLPNGDMLAFEEACALRRLTRHGKYDGSYEDVATLIRQIPCQPLAQSLANFFAMVALAMITRNGDAHLENFGVLYDHASDVRLAPAYDLVCTTPYLREDVPALALGGVKAWPSRAVLERFGTQHCLLRPKEARVILERVTEAVRSTLVALRRFARERPQTRSLCERMTRAWRDGLALAAP